ncbi:response regulator transcription factor [Gallaecimonas kandeliae]|uniref:response regulator transcription factor n=1 Tax=Gallaecimonas kandeliae TaxID=3029055 RepID=UPI002648B4CF|nr:response regulator transcription factor [Gallaecimonas kandeliae]WKE67310.1 response regulator transcription factor [Gallaecimonas kandeliae]
MNQVQILIADDHPLLRAAVRLTIEAALPGAVIREAADVQAMEAAIGEGLPDLVLLDLTMPGANGFSSLILLRQQHPALPVVVLSAHEDDSSVNRAYHHGAQGFVPKSANADAIGQALKAVLAGDNWFPPGFVPDAPCDQETRLAEGLAALTPQQYKVLVMFADGLLNKQIAYELGVSEATIKAHATAIFRKLDVRNRTQAVIALQSLGPVPDPSWHAVPPA